MNKTFLRPLKHFIHQPYMALLAMMASVLLPLLAPLSAQADFSSQQQAKVSITFDDGYATTYDKALPILDRAGIEATAFVTTSQIGQPGYMTWDKVKKLQNDYQWEIGSHTVTHPELPTLTTANIATELQQSKSALVNQGLQVSSFASPYGAYDNRVVAEAMRSYNLHRGFWDRDTLNAYPYDRSVVRVKSLEEGVTVQQVKIWIDAAVSQKQWLVLVLHEVGDTLDPNYEYTTTTADLSQIAEYIRQRNVPDVLMNHTLTKPGPNLMPNSSFEQGIGQGWSTDAPTKIVANMNNMGSYPSAKHSIQLTGGVNAGHLFAPRIPASTGTYLVEAMVNADGFKSGELGFYIDEFNAGGEWVSGQWLGAVANGSIRHLSASYAPTSAMVASFSIQTYTTAGSSGVAYLDNMTVYRLDGQAPQPTPVATPTPAPTVTPTPAINQTLRPLADTFVAAQSASKNYGTAKSLEADGSPTKAIYMKYDLAGIDASRIQSAKLRLYVVNASASTQLVKQSEVTNWSETAMTWNTKPTLHSTTLGSITKAKVGTWVEVDLTSIVKAKAGTLLSLGIDSSGSDGLDVSSRESSTNQPHLALTFASNPNPTPAPTPTPAFNLVKNFSFEELLNGWAAFWQRDTNAVVSINQDSLGNHQLRSLAFDGSPTTAAHAFSERIGNIVSAQTYEWQHYIDARYSAGEFGFYVDEYDVNGNWISGQWLGSAGYGYRGTLAHRYRPTSAAVSSIGLQYYATAGTAGQILVDSVKLAPLAN
jgi:peptidoglycan/xylan/chitin deacetylase (PgdA/CDA1 family)